MNFRSFVLVLNFLFAIVYAAFSQNNVDQLFKQAESFANNRDYEKSNDLYNEIIASYTKAENWLKYYETRYAITYNYIDLYQFELAKLEIEEAIQHFERNYKDTFDIIQPRLYHAAGKVYLELHQYEKAITNNRLAMQYYQQVTDNTQRMKYTSYMYNNIGAVYKRKRSMDSALVYFKKALPLKIESLGKNSNSTLRTIKSIAGIYQDWGQLDRAIETQTIALDGALEEGNLDAEAKAYNGLSQMYQRKKDYESAKLYISKSMEIYKSMGSENLIDVAHSYHQMGNVLEAEKAHQESIEWYSTAKKMYREIHNGKPSYPEGNSTMTLGKAYNFLAEQLEATSLDIDGNTAEVRKLRAKAIEYYEENEQIYTASISKDHARWIELWLSKGVCLIENLDTLGANELFQKAYDRAYLAAPNKSYDRSLACLNLARTTKNIPKALDLYQQGLWELSNGWEYSSIDDNPTAEQVFYEDWSVQIMYNKAERIRQLALSQKDPKLLLSGIKSINAADKLLAESRASFLTTSAKIFLGRKGHDVYSKGVELCYDLKNQEAQAFEFIEKDKGLVLLEALHSGNRIHDVMVADSISNKLQRISSKIAELTANQNQFKNNEKLSTIGAEIFDLEQERKAIKALIKKQYPITSRISEQSQIRKLEEVQEKLYENEVIYEYAQSDHHLYILKIAKDNSQLYKEDIRNYTKELDELLQLISDENIAINRSNSPEIWNKFQKLSHQLFNILLPDYSQEDLLIIPDGKLNYLPFELLLTQPSSGDQINYSQLPYLLKSAIIKYAFSSTLHYAFNETSSESKDNLLAIAPSYPASPIGILASRSGFTSLAHTEKEASSISKIMNGEYLVDKEATVENFKDKVSDYKVLHLAMHAYTHDKDPMLSGMVFSESNTDNILHAHELYNMNIPCDLVVLSACNTGLGQYQEGEGVMSLGRAFRHAGTNNIVMSLWQANDESTSEIMEGFYRNLGNGEHKAKALRDAKISYLNSSSHAFPYFWSSFVLLGDDKPLDITSNDHTWLYKGLAVMLLFLIVRFYKSKKSID